MAMDAAMIERLIKAGLPDAKSRSRICAATAITTPPTSSPARFAARAACSSTTRVPGTGRPDGRRTSRAGAANQRARGVREQTMPTPVKTCLHFDGFSVHAIVMPDAFCGCPIEQGRRGKSDPVQLQIAVAGLDPAIHAFVASANSVSGTWMPDQVRARGAFGLLEGRILDRGAASGQRTNYGDEPGQDNRQA